VTKETSFAKAAVHCSDSLETEFSDNLLLDPTASLAEELITTRNSC